MDMKNYFLDSRDKKLYEGAPPENAQTVLWHVILAPPPAASDEEPGVYGNTELRDFLQSLSVDDDIITSCTTPLRFPEVELFDGGVSLRFPIRMAWDEEHSSYLTLLCLQGRLISISSCDAPMLSRARQLLRSGSEPVESSSQGLLTYLLDTCADLNIHHYMSARADVEELAARIDDDPNQVSLDDLVPVRRRIGRLFSQFEDQYYCMATLYTLQSPQVSFTHLKADLRDIMDGQNHVARSQERLEVRLRDLQHDCTLFLQRKTDHRIRVLTILTAVCMPLSVIAGIYGMNFDHMPELKWANGYYLTLSLMATVVVALLLFFHRRGWFK